jgi:hypothetical protein
MNDHEKESSRMALRAQTYTAPPKEEKSCENCKYFMKSNSVNVWDICGAVDDGISKPFPVSSIGKCDLFEKRK